MTTLAHPIRPRPTLRRVVLYLVIGSFTLAAAMGIGALLIGDSFGETQGKILLTTLAVGLASLAVLACFSTLDTRFQPVGFAGAALVLVPLGMALFLIWRSFEQDPPQAFLEWFGNSTTVAVALAQICLLLAAAGSKERLRVLLWVTVVLAAAMALVVVALIMGWVNGDQQWRWIGTLAILDVLGTIVTIALSKFGGGMAASSRASRSETYGLSPAVLARIDQRAAAQGRTRAAVVDEALQRYLDG